MQRRRLVLIGNRSSRRTDLLREAAGRVGVDVELVTWLDLICQRADLRQIVRDGDVVRLDSPGKDFETERAILTLFDRRHADLAEERGRIIAPADWYAAFCTALDLIEHQLAECPSHTVSADPRDIRVMFDKTATQAHLAAAGVAVPPAIGRIESLGLAIHAMGERRWRQGFFKLAHGSSASGAMAFRHNGRGRTQGFTTVEIDGTDRDGRPRLFNTRRIRHLDRLYDVAQVVNALAPHGLHLERWMPKAGIDGCAFDLRVVMIDGQPCHIVPRLSKSPMTNLHLLNQRGDLNRVVERVGPANWEAAMESCRAAARVFGRSTMCGIDLMFAPGFGKHYVLEVNAFGDLLPGILWRGMDTYESQLRLIMQAAEAA